jgi:DNA-binding CsgD family transcriptional regulator
MVVLRGTARPGGAPFRPISAALLALTRCGGPPQDRELVPYRASLARFVPEWRDSGLAADEPLLVVAEGLLRLLAVLGRTSGCALVLEDLHDADAETLAVVDHLADNTGELPVSLLVTARDERGPLRDLVYGRGRRPGVVVVEPARLDSAQVRELVAACLGVADEEVPGEVVERLVRTSEGVPFVVEELLDAMIAHGALVAGPDGWVGREARTPVPITVVQSVAARVALLGPGAGDLLAAAAVLGRRFPVRVLAAMTGLGQAELLVRLRQAVGRGLVGPDEAADWYAFRHALTADAQLALLGAAEHAELARRAAAAVELCHPGLPGDWGPVAARLWLTAGEHGKATRLFTAAGERALADGAAATAVQWLREALHLAGSCAERIAAVEPLLAALADAGEVDQAFTLAPLVQDDPCLDDDKRASLHITLAQVATRAGQWSRGFEQVTIARALLGPDAAPGRTGMLDVLTARLTLETPGIDRRAVAERLVSRALAAAESAGLTALACEALELLGTLTRQRDLTESDRCFARMTELAHRAGLHCAELTALARCGVNENLRSGADTRLRRAHERAFAIGAITEGYLLEANLVMVAVMRGEFVRAAKLADHCLPMVTRLGHRYAIRYALMAKAAMFAHRGLRPEMTHALAEFTRWGGQDSHQLPLTHGLCEAICALLEEDRPAAVKALDRAVECEELNPTIYVLAGRFGLRVLLGVLDGELDARAHAAAAATSAGELAWNRQFLLLAEAVLHGRAGHRAKAAETMTAHGAVAAPFAMARRLGLRLVADAAIADGWGEPAAWLRDAEAHFRAGGATAVSIACRNLLRRAGWAVTQHHDAVPERLRVLGVTSREHEVLRLLAERLGNTEIGRRLYISPRTVEKHVASLLAKSGERDRAALHRFALVHVD